ncbi:GH25 family lysozyme [Fructilactobacillus sp. Tb1]|uniref:GH25 family lysozyme n=1 Tax=Fructilactobacillus sp. Tb1 TaxID=3422304 RepID=UPI003D29ACED
MQVKKILPSLIIIPLFLTCLSLTANAKHGDLGTDVSKYQSSVINVTGKDKFSFAQIGGTINGWIYDQAPYSYQVNQGRNDGFRMHSYVWLQDGANQAQTKAAMDYFLSKIQTPYGSDIGVDWEEGASADKEANTANVIYAMQLIKQADFTPVLYSSRNYLNQTVNVGEIIKQFPNSLWLAEYWYSGDIEPDFNHFPTYDNVAMWQYNYTPRDLDVDLTGITDNGYTKNTNVNPSDQPIAPQPQPAKPAWNPQIYTVQSGDTLNSISNKVGDSVATLEANNQVSNLIYPGQKLLVNNFNHYNLNENKLTQRVRYVQPGDSLTRLSYLIGDSWQTIVANNLDVFTNGYYSIIYTGQPIYFYR